MAQVMPKDVYHEMHQNETANNLKNNIKDRQPTPFVQRNKANNDKNVKELQVDNFKQEDKSASVQVNANNKNVNTRKNSLDELLAQVRTIRKKQEDLVARTDELNKSFATKRQKRVRFDINNAKEKSNGVYNFVDKGAATMTRTLSQPQFQQPKKAIEDVVRLNNSQNTNNIEFINDKIRRRYTKDMQQTLSKELVVHLVNFRNLLTIWPKRFYNQKGILKKYY
jgi:hypothetical protein